MNYNAGHYKKLIGNMINGFAFHKIILNNSGIPIDYEYLEINDAFEKLTGLSRINVIGKRVTNVIPDIKNDEFDWVGFYGKVALGGGSNTTEQYSKVMNRWYTVSAYCTDIEYFAVVFNDITDIKQKEKELRNNNEELGQLYEELAASEEELRQQNEHLMENQSLLMEKDEKLQYLAYHDALTGLPNRTLFEDRLSMICKLSKRIGEKSAVFFMDLDNFKRINDSYGHIIGDEVLREVSTRLSACIREYDTVARVSGDEFAAVFHGFVDTEEIYILAQRFKDTFSEPFETSALSCYSSISIGIAVIPDDSVIPTDIIRYADTALYKAKENGKNNIQFFNISMRDEILRKVNIEGKLRRAIENKEFVLHYQPQYNVHTGNLRGLEALVRWENKDLGLVNPMYFIPAAEETGLIVPLGRWILTEACKAAKCWRDIYECNAIMSVNISAVQLKSVEFLHMVKEVLQQTGLNPEKLELEITESILINNYDLTIALLSELREYGIKISLDDFGTGYSSLSYLKSLPINTLKIDKSFIKNICSDKTEREITGAVIDLVHKLGLETVAEGVETKEQMEYLRQNNCDNIQGFHVGRPVPMEMVPDIIKRRCTRQPLAR